MIRGYRSRREKEQQDRRQLFKCSAGSLCCRWPTFAVSVALVEPPTSCQPVVCLLSQTSPFLIGDTPPESTRIPRCSTKVDDFKGSRTTWAPGGADGEGNVVGVRFRRHFHGH